MWTVHLLDASPTTVPALDRTELGRFVAGLLDRVDQQRFAIVILGQLSQRNSWRPRCWARANAASESRIGVSSVPLTPAFWSALGADWIPVLSTAHASSR